MSKMNGPLAKYNKSNSRVSKTKGQMKNKMHHLLRILNKLEGKERISVRSLMSDLGCSERAVHRYLSDLREEFPIFYDRDMQTYAFSDGFSLRQPNMTIEEAFTLTMAKKVLSGMGQDMEKSLASIEQKLSTANKAFPKTIILSGEQPSPALSAHVGELCNAIANLQRIEIAYRALYSDEESHRVVEPCYLFFHENLWHLRAYCCEQESLRTFAIDRIQSCRILDEHFMPKLESTPEDDFSGAFGAFVDGDPVEVVLKFDAEIKHYVLRKKWHASQREKELKDGRLEVRFKINGLDGIRPWVYRWLPYVDVQAPLELKKEMRADLSTALQRLKPGNRK